MSDLINRQDAIDIVMKYGKKIPPYAIMCKDAMEKLPSAGSEIIRCKDCKYARLSFDGSCKYCDIWFPNEPAYVDGDYYCASAERRTDDRNMSI